MGRILAALALCLGLAGQVHAQPVPSLPTGGGDSGPVSVSASPANSSHAAGTSVGGLFTIPIVRTLGGSGIITNFMWKSVAGSTGSAVVRIWSKKPIASNCTDNAAFQGATGDDLYLITPPFSIAPAAPSVTTGDSSTYASVQGVTWDYANADSVWNAPTVNLYACVVTVSTDSTDGGSTVVIMLSGPQN